MRPRCERRPRIPVRGPFGWCAAGVAALGAVMLLACTKTVDPRPSVLLVVIDTLRTDAVSAHGAVEGTTPTLDALAAEGLDYRQAYSTSSWTLPSHASLFTGLGVDRHGMGMAGRLTLSDDEVTLAERFAKAGYDTASFTENMLVSDAFNMLQGFQYKRGNRIYRKGEHNDLPMNVYWELELDKDVRKWLQKRDSSRPFFVFVNIMDAHNPYRVRDVNPFVKPGLSRDELGRYAKEPQQNLCDALPPPEYVDGLHGLYLDGVAHADAKVKTLLEEIHEIARPQKLITVVAGDHGELFGERRLLGHEFNLRNSALHVPLIVHGVPDTKPAVMKQTVSLMDVAPSLLAWTGQPVPSGLDGRVLPTSPDAPAAARVLEAAYSDAYVIAPAEWKGVVEFLDKNYPRRACGPNDKVFGGMAALLDPPFKFIWFERYKPELYDLSWDPEERSDLAPVRPELVKRYEGELQGFIAKTGLAGPADAKAARPSQEAVDSLRALGYVR